MSNLPHPISFHTSYFMLGGLLAYLVADEHLVGCILSHLPPSFHPLSWKGGYQTALPAVKKATYDAIAHLTHGLPDEIRDDVSQMLLWLCEPDPRMRGHPDSIRAKHGDPHSLERLISVADRVEKQARRIK